MLEQHEVTPKRVGVDIREKRGEREQDEMHNVRKNVGRTRREREKPKG